MPTIIRWTRNRGRDGWSGSPLLIRPDMSAQSVNVILYEGGLGSKRAGSSSITLSGYSDHNAMVEFVPGQDLTAAELFTVDNSGTKQILRSTTGSSTAKTDSALTLKDNIASAAYEFSAVTLNGKLYMAYDSTVNRLHVFDPGLSTTEVRRAGMGTPAAPTAATLGGAGLTFTGTYKVAYTEQRSSVTVRRSELSPSVAVSITDDSGIRVTKPAAISEGETHWELYRLGTDGTYYLLATTVVGTTTVDDTSSTPPSTTAEPTAGSNTPFPSVKFLGTDGNRLYGLGVWESSAGDSMSPKAGRFYFGPVLDSSSVHDDERINNTTELQGFIDLARNAGSPDRGVTKKPVNNVIYAFQSDAHFGLIPTESPTTPYRRVPYYGSGAWTNQSIVVADARDGSTAAFFLDPVKGPFTQGGKHGLKWCGKDVKDIWDTVNRDASTLGAWGIWWADRNLILFGIATGANNVPNKGIALDPTEMFLDEEGDLRGGWVEWTGDLLDSKCAVVFSNTFASTRSRTRVPYFGRNSGTVLLKYDETVTSDNSAAFQAYVRSGSLADEVVGLELRRAHVRASAESGVTIRQTLIRNTGDETNRTSDVVLTAVGSETHVRRKFEDAALQDGDTFQVQLGDASAVASAWDLVGWISEIKLGAPL
jgi:hypothetical protein